MHLLDTDTLTHLHAGHPHFRQIQGIIVVNWVVERQRDHNNIDWKYLIKGQTDDQIDVIVVAKLSPTDTVVIITVYVE